MPGREGFGADDSSVVVAMGATITRLIWLVTLSSIDAVLPGPGAPLRKTGVGLKEPVLAPA